MMTGGERKTSLLANWTSDFFGSDVFVGYQGTYVWQANQLGHIAIGLILASVLSWAFGHWECDDSLFFALCAGVVAVYALKELIDLRMAKRQCQDLFKMNERELWYDMAADTWFVASGVGMAAAAHAVHWWGLAAFGVALLAFFALRAVFVPAKRSLDRAGFPYMFRLCNFPKTEGVEERNVSRILAFITNRKTDGYEPSRAVLIQGYPGTGKSTLAVGIGTEAALHKRNGKYGRVRYLTAFSLFEPSACEGMRQAWRLKRRTRRLLGTGDPWSVECAEVLIIDDVDSDNGIYGTKRPKEILDKLKEQDELCELLKSKRTVWVTGTSQFEKKRAAQGWVAWHDALSEFYGYEVDRKKTAKNPVETVAREPIPVIWLQQPLV